MKGRFKNSIRLIYSSIRFFLKYPISILPLLFCWMVYAPIILYFKFYFNWEPLSTADSIGVLFTIYFVFSFIIGLSCLILLEIAQQIETTGEINLLAAIKDCMTRDLIRALPILLIWSIIWLVLVVMQTLLSKKKTSNNDDESLTAKSAAETLAGIEEGFSFCRAFFSALNKGVRMLVFLILPAVAWEESSPFNAIKKGFVVLRVTIPEFISGFALTELFSSMIFIPPTIIFLLEGYAKMNFPDVVWYIVLVYVAFSWSLSFLVEQLYVAELYLWYLSWEKNKDRALAEGKKIPKLKSVKKPSFFDEFKSLDI